MLNLQRRPPKIITFDCYGTLVQWHRAVNRAAAAILNGHVSVSPSAIEVATLADLLRSLAVEHQQRKPFQKYRAVLKASLTEALAQRGHTASPDDLGVLLRILGRIEPHPEVPLVLKRLRERYRVAIISNTADDLLAGTLDLIGAPIDHVITAEQARAYKPDHRLFLHAYAMMGVAKDDTVHVGMGQFTDLKVCTELGIRSVWIDREGEPLDPAWRPDAVLKDLSRLPDLLIANR